MGCLSLLGLLALASDGLEEFVGEGDVGDGLEELFDVDGLLLEECHVEVVGEGSVDGCFFAWVDGGVYFGGEYFLGCEGGGVGGLAYDVEYFVCGVVLLYGFDGFVGYLCLEVVEGFEGVGDGCGAVLSHDLGVGAAFAGEVGFALEGVVDAGDVFKEFELGSKGFVDADVYGGGGDLVWEVALSVGVYDEYAAGACPGVGDLLFG